MNSNIELWQNTLGTLQKDLDEDSFNDLFAGLTEIYKEENNYIYIVVPNSLNQYRIEKFYSNKINEIGQLLSEKYDIPYLYSDFKKKEGYKHSIEMSKEYGLYRQDYCGCIYSKLERMEKKRSD